MGGGEPPLLEGYGRKLGGKLGADRCGYRGGGVVSPQKLDDILPPAQPLE
jgi:hypothetical protein